MLKESSTNTRATLCLVSQQRVAGQGAKSRGSKLSRKAPLLHSSRWDPRPPARCSTHGYNPMYGPHAASAAARLFQFQGLCSNCSCRWFLFTSCWLTLAGALSLAAEAQG